MRKKKTTEEFKKELYKINPNIEILGTYINNKTKINCKCKIDGYEWCPTPTGLLSKKGCPKCSHKIKLTQKEFEEKLFKVNPNIKIMSSFNKYAEKIHVKCNIDGFEWDETPSNLIYSHKGCPICNKYCHTTIKGYNDMWTTNPELAKLLVDKEDGFKYTQRSNKKVNWKCPNCGEIIKNKCINSIFTNGLSCPKCSDGVKYPEKFMYNLLKQLDIDFEYQLSHLKFNWCKNDNDNYNIRYDFYIPSLNCIIETHGLQHYDESGRGRSLSEEKSNDIFKEKLAKENGITKYIIIDCRKSDLEFIKNNILNSQINYLFNLSNIDWLKIDKQCQKSLVQTACELWNSGTYSTLEISKLIKLNRSTIIGYLSKGYQLGLCYYDAKKEQIKNGRNNSKKGNKKVICITTGEIFDSLTNAANKYILKTSYISRCCRYKRNYTGKLLDGTKLVWMFYNEYINTL